MLVLFETPAGFAVFKLLDEKKLSQCENLYNDFETLDGAKKVVKLKMFEKFEDTTEALASAVASVEGKMSKGLKKLLKKIVAKDAHTQLAVSDSKLGNIIQDKLQLSCVSNSKIFELMRCIRSQMSGLISAVPDGEMSAMSLGLAHSLSRYKLKFSPDKIDTMIVQAVCLLDDLDKELNNYIMRCREWYGWHFPELGKIITDNIAYVMTVQLIGLRENASSTDLSDILPEDVDKKVKAAAEISMGTEITDTDLINIRHLCDQVVQIQSYRSELFEYLKNRMMAVAPNLTILVGELVGARLISHAGSLLNLAKHPASTVQILGAEKALFKALKSKHDTPKYGLIYHAQVIGQSSTKLKGKAARMLAAKASLASRTDALSDETCTELGFEARSKVEQRIKSLEAGHSFRISGTGRQSGHAKTEKYENKSNVYEYKNAADSTLNIKRSVENVDCGDNLTPEVVKRIKIEDDEDVPMEKKKKKKRKEVTDESEDKESSELSSEKIAKKKKKIGENEIQNDQENGQSKKKKKKSMVAEAE